MPKPKESASVPYRIDLGLHYVAAQERAAFQLEPSNGAPNYVEIAQAEELRDAAEVAKTLQSLDWGFEQEQTQFLTHDIHPYPAKFIPQIPGNLISRLSLRGELVLDPFGGSGTTALEAVRLGRRAISIDANPVATLIGRTKTCNLDVAASTDLHGLRSALSSFLVDMPSAERLCEDFKASIPLIPNIEKWFPPTSRGELAFIKSKIDQIETPKARDIAQLALSKTVLGASFQDSETRYSSKPRNISLGETTRKFIASLDLVIRNIAGTRPELRYGVSEFLTADTKSLRDSLLPADSVDLVVTSPPYGNANDYHLYHRFRLLWLGFDPIALGKIEIGSHLRHQKESSGFDSYLSEMAATLQGMFRVLRPGRYAALVVGDAVYEGATYPGAESLRSVAREVGFEHVCIIQRQLHRTKRSFTVAGRRAVVEKILVLRKPARNVLVRLFPPPYKLWPYEAQLRLREVHAILGVKTKRDPRYPISITIDPYIASRINRLAFSHGASWDGLDVQPTWQRILENGLAATRSARKDPKYVTHGIHPYKGKFYPQLAKGLFNLVDLPSGSTVLDPFCGSGTTLLESYLNGYRSHGCDMNPLAARIARAKVAILEADPDVFSEVVGTILARLDNPPAALPTVRDQFHDSCHAELTEWFPLPVLNKANWLLKLIRSSSEGVIRAFLEIVLSSIVREISQQDPSDLRIRRRKVPLKDADVFNLYAAALRLQCQRIERFWSVRGYSASRFFPSRVVCGDSRAATTFTDLGVGTESVDLLLTSPPYATALPYIDTDRLSLLMLFGMPSSDRRPLEHSLTGSREITNRQKTAITEALLTQSIHLPRGVKDYLSGLAERIGRADVGFRRENMPALLTRFCVDMDKIIGNCAPLLRRGGQAMIVIGDNKIRVKTRFERIPTTDLVSEIATSHGLRLLEKIDISVTTENLVHVKHAITENVVLRLQRPPAAVH